jgi:hypothetical protein
MCAQARAIVNQSLFPSSAGDARINCFKLDIVTLGALKTSIICLSRLKFKYLFSFLHRRMQQQQPTTHISIISHTGRVRDFDLYPEKKSRFLCN